MRRFLILASLLAAAPASAGPRVPLAPPTSEATHALGIGPRSVPDDHPLRGRISVEPIAGMPDRVGTLFIPIARPAEFDDALRLALGKSAMLAGTQAAPKVRLLVTWRRIDAPAKISASAYASVAIAYELRRTDNGQTIFLREIKTESRATGGAATERVRLNARMAIQRNIAAAVACMDRAAYGQAPGDCAAWASAGPERPMPSRRPRPSL